MMDHRFTLESDPNDYAEGGDNELFSIIHKIDSTEIVYSQPKVKYKLIGPYIKGDILGEGSYGKVKECVHSRTLQRCAVKIMKHRTLKRIPNGEQNVQREIKLLRGLDHKNIIHLIEDFTSNEKQKIYMVMEYCIIGLQQMLDGTPDKKLPQWQAHRYFVQLVEGLKYLQCKGVVHKDIKPGNLLINTNNILKIIDFGVAEQISPLAADDMINTSQGCPVFQPPEVAGGDSPFPGFKVDVWSAGVTLYNITSGKYPFDGANMFRLFENICEEPVEIPLELDESLTDLLKGMLIKDPYARMSIYEVSNHCWCQRKQSPMGLPAVSLVPPQSSRPKFTVIDAVRHHFYEDNEDMFKEFVTEHELNETKSRDDQLSLSSDNGKSGPTKKKRKPVSCLSLKGLASCSQS